MIKNFTNQYIFQIVSKLSSNSIAVLDAVKFEKDNISGKTITYQGHMSSNDIDYSLNHFR